MATSFIAEKMSDEHQSSEESEFEEETDSDDSEEDAEPRLCYDRVRNDLASVLSKDCASCMAVHSKFLALGTHWGAVRIMDYLGHIIQGKEFEHHTTTVNHISVDQTGDFIASCSDDGKVCIIGLYSNEAPHIVDFNRPVKSVALEPDYSKSRSKQFVIGTNDDKLVLNEKGYFGSKKTTIHDGGGSIREIRWCGHLLAWSDDTGVRVYDFTSRSRITSISKDHNHRPDLYHCNLHWKDERTLLVGWADTVKVVLVKDRLGQDVRDLPPRYCEIIAQFTTPEYFICGIASLENDLVLLTYDKAYEKEAGRITYHKPNLRIVEPHMEYCDEVSNDVLSMNGYQTHRCNDYHLENVIEDNLFYIVSPKDVIVARPRDLDDHITWLLEHDEYEQAMEAANQHGKELKKHSFQAIGRKFLDYLTEEQRFEDAAKLCRRIFGKDKEKWEAEAYKFARINQLKCLAPFLPKEQPTLNPAIYEMVLNDYLQSDYKVFLQLIKEWPFTLYKVQAIIQVVIDRLDKDRQNEDLLHALAELYGYERAFDKALGIYLKLKDNDVFVLIHKHSLYEAVSDKVVKLMELNEEHAVTMLIDNIEHIPVEKVVRQLEKQQRFLYVYLDRLAKKNQQAIKPYADQMVTMYSEFNRAKLLPFLKSGANLSLDKALNEVKVRGFKQEQVYLLVRTGSTKTALQLIIDEIRDVDQAIEFCKEHNDDELWEDLIKHSLDKPEFIKGLLNNIGTHVDPIKLIIHIKTGMEIPGLRDSLVKILQDYNLQMSLRKGCKAILVADSYNLMNRLIQTQRRAIPVDSSYLCQICHQRIIVAETYCTKDVTMFFCSHAVHDDCLGQMETCPICSTQRRGPGSSSAIGRK